MFTLKSLRVRGFRGFLDTDAGDFDLASPITILFGQNGRGKSSVLNAIEWGLFGNECSGKETNIRERVNWIVANQHANPGNVSVELEIQDDDGTCLVRRKLRSRGRRKVSDGDMEIEMPDSDCLVGVEAARFLDRLHRSCFRDAEDDPLALLNDEAGKIDRQLKKLAKAIEEKQGRLDQIERELENLRIIDDILHLEEKKQFIEQLKQSPEYKELEELLDRVAELVNVINSQFAFRDLIR